MRQKNGKTEYKEYDSSATYQTGSTCPPKSYRGIIAFLLGVVILLCGISTALGLLNIRLFRELSQQPETAEPALAFSRDLPTPAASQKTALGFTGETITDFWHTYHNLPRGVFIQTVEPGSEAARKGIVPGDILISVNGTEVDCIETLNQQLQACQPGQSVQLIVYREEQLISFSLTLDERN